MLLKKKHVYKQYIDAKHMYDGAVASVGIIGGETNNFPITIGLNQGSALISICLLQL